MTTERLEHSGSAGTTTITADLAPATTVVSVDNGTGFPTGGVGRFVITVGRGTDNEERMLCSLRSGNAITVDERGWDGSVPRSHVAGAACEHTWSATEADLANAHTSADTDVHGVTGEVVGTTDAQALSNKTLIAPAVTDFTNAAHDHGDADDGGNIPQASVTSLVSDLAAKASTSYVDTNKQDVSEKGQAGGYASLDGSTKVPFAELPTGTSASTVSEGDHVHDPLDAEQTKVTTLWAAGNTSYASGGCWVTMVAPPSGRFKVDAYGRASHQDSGATCWFSIAAYEGTGVGGTEVLAGANTRASATSGMNPGAVAVSEIITGYTPGDTYTISTSTKSTGGTGGNAEFALQSIIVTPLP